MNQTLEEIGVMLMRQMLALSEKLGNTVDQDLAQAILNEMQEINHRINLIQRLIFIQQSDRIEKKLPAIRESDQKLQEEINDIQGIVNLVKAVTGFLKLVDEVIDIAKVLP